MAQQPLLVLFLSTGNAARSILAEALLNAKQSGLYRARSGGIEPFAALPIQTRALLENLGYDTEKLHPKKWQDFYAAGHLVKVSVIVTLSEEARQALPYEWPGHPVRVHWTIDDPMGAEREDVRDWKFRKCLSTLQARLDVLCRHRPAASDMELFLMFKEIGMVV